jgi:hypothetical protein
MWYTFGNVTLMIVGEPNLVIHRAGGAPNPGFCFFFSESITKIAAQSGPTSESKACA